MRKIIAYFSLILVTSYSSAQSIVSINPSSSEVNKTLTVGISGRCTHFYQTSSTTTIFWLANGTNVISSSSVNASSNTSMTGSISVPSGAPLGLWDLYVYNNVDDTLKLTNAFEVYDCNVNPPSIVSLSPKSSEAGKTLSVSISGRCTHFYQTSSTTSTFWLANGGNVIAPSSVNASSDTYLSGNVSVPSSATLGFWDLYVYNNVDDTLKLTNAFEVYDCNVTPPSLISVSPNSSQTGNNLTVGISGRCTHFYQTSSTTSVFWLAQGANIITPSSVNASSNTFILGGISIPSNVPLGLWDIYVYNNVDDTLVLTDGFEVYACYPTGIHEVQSRNTIPVSIYPNPFNNTASFVIHEADKGQQYTLCFYNVFGQMVKRIDDIRSSTIQINRDLLPTGIYIYKLESSGGKKQSGRVCVTE